MRRRDIILIAGWENDLLRLSKLEHHGAVTEKVHSELELRRPSMTCFLL